MVDKLVLIGEKKSIYLIIYSFNNSTPTIILFHGLTGSSNEDYVQWIIYEGEKKGFRCVVMNARGCGNTELKTDKFFCAIKTDDITLAINYIKEKLPKNTPLHAVGVSLGSHILMNYIGEQGDKCILKSAVAISPPYNLMRNHLELQRTFMGRNIYDRIMDNLLKKLFNKNVLKNIYLE